jgi:hypothetical protein
MYENDHIKEFRAETEKIEAETATAVSILVSDHPDCVQQQAPVTLSTSIKTKTSLLEQQQQIPANRQAAARAELIFRSLLGRSFISTVFRAASSPSDSRRQNLSQNNDNGKPTAAL